MLELGDMLKECGTLVRDAGRLYAEDFPIPEPEVEPEPTPEPQSESEAQAEPQAEVEPQATAGV